MAGTTVAPSMSSAAGSAPFSRPAVDGAPSPPQNVQATAEGAPMVTDAALVTWTAPTSPGVGDITSYAVVPNDLTTGVTGGPTIVDGDPPAMTVTVSGLVAGHGYTFTVTAANFGGPSDASDPSNAVVPVAVAPSQTNSATSSTPSGSATASLGTPGSALSISATGTGGEGTLEVATYPSEPVGSSHVDGDFYDVRLIVGFDFTQLQLVFCGVAMAGSVRFWNATTQSFVSASEQSAPSGPGRCVTVTLNGATTPEINDLTGTVFVVPSPGAGYDLVGSDGGVFAFGDAGYLGSLPALGVSVRDVVGMTVSPEGGGYWLVGSDGGVFAFGDAGFHGSLFGRALAGAVVGMAATADGGGYWLVGSDGGVFAFGDAGYLGSLPGLGVSVHDVVGMAVTPDGGGYWLVGSDGGIFAFGDARFHGSLFGRALQGAVVGMAATSDGGGYWLVGSDGGVFAFGDATYSGSLPALGVSAHDVVGMAATPDGGGYWLVGSDGGVFAFGDAGFHGSLFGTALRGRVVGGLAA